MPSPALSNSIATIPAGRWAVGVSGGADSVALLRLLLTRSDLTLHVVHLDHQTREGASSEDASFVRSLCHSLSVPCHLAIRSDIEPACTDLSANLSSRFRAVRMKFFADVVRENGLQGLILAHHADDQIETVLLRLLRGSSIVGLSGMKRASDMSERRILRPLLGIRSTELRQYLASIGQTWCEDASNQSDAYARNRVRRTVTDIAVDSPDVSDALFQSLMSLAECATNLNDWIASVAPSLPAQFRITELSSPPSILAEYAAKHWLASQGVSPEEITPSVVKRLIEMAGDASSVPRQDFPTRVRLARTKGVIAKVTF